MVGRLTAILVSPFHPVPQPCGRRNSDDIPERRVFLPKMSDGSDDVRTRRDYDDASPRSPTS